MLPLGRLALGKRDTKFTPDEQRTLMTLWSIARSPLIMGGDLRHLDAPTLALLTNRAVIAVNQASTDNRPHFLEDGTRIWSAKPEGAPNDRYLALFNTTTKPKAVGIALGEMGLTGNVAVTDLWTGKALPRATRRVEQTLPPHGSGLYRLQA
jgi:hypothetical protein